MSLLKAKWLQNAYDCYIEWLWDKEAGWGYANGWHTHFAEMILWYSTAGSARGSEKMAWTNFERVRKGQFNKLWPLRRRTWKEGCKLASEICQKRKTNPVDWFTGGCESLIVALNQLDDIPGIGPKIAAFIMRDLSFMRDYSDGKGGIGVPYRNRRNTHWFDRLSPEEQAFFIPIDIYVHEGARRHCSSRTCSNYGLARIQQDPDLYRRAATEIVEWSRKRAFDPRELDVYWYSLGAGDIHKDGTCTEEE